MQAKHVQFLIAVAIVVAMPLFMQSGSLASEVLIYGLAAMGCNLLLGYTGLLSFGQGIFFGLGSYTLGILLTRLPLPMPVALASAVLVGAAGAAWVVCIAVCADFYCLSKRFAFEIVCLSAQAALFIQACSKWNTARLAHRLGRRRTIWPLSRPKASRMRRRFFVASTSKSLNVPTRMLGVSYHW